MEKYNKKARSHCHALVLSAQMASGDFLTSLPGNNDSDKV